LETDAAALSALLESGSVVSSDPTEAVRRALAPDSALDEQHLVLLLVDSAFDPEPVRELCEAKQIRLHCWRLSQHPDKAGPPGVFRTEEQSATIWPRFVAASAARYTLSAGRVPTAVTVRNATVKPARFSGRADLLKGGQNA
jgi:hypothetical protein